jgi:outer membrane protein OmpA-like peptidoglycan-associated protein
MVNKILVIVFAAGLSSACCHTGTTVVLMPDPDGKVGQVAVKTRAGSTVLTHDHDGAEADVVGEAPTKPHLVSDDTIKEHFGEVLAIEPLPPKHSPFYFESGKADLSPESQSVLAEVKSAIDARKSCDISVIGHADRVGTNELNEGISMQRADAVLNALSNLGVNKNCVDKRYYGENDPAVPTADEVPEPRNRRVEVEIR